MTVVAKIPRTDKPSSTPLPATLQEEYVELGRLDNDRLRQELTTSLHVTAAHLRRLALIVRLLEERGEDLADLRIGILPYLRQIAHGQVLPEVIVRFAESPWLVRLIGGLPLPDQKRLADGERIELMVRREQGFEKRLADPLAMTREQVLLAFSRDRLRTEEEQILILEERKPARPRDKSPGKVKVERRTGLLRIGKATVTVPEVLAAIAELRHGDDDDDEPEDEKARQMIVKLTEIEHQTLKETSAKAGVSMQRLVRRAMHDAGLI